MMLEPGTLWKRTQEQTRFALQCGALQSIPTEYQFIEQDGILFFVRIVSNLARKEQAKQQQEQKSETSGKPFNPFLPYEKDLFVADLSPTHLGLLNKYNVLDHHLLIVTREFEEQENLLTLQDFQALWIALAEIDGLVFYNGGADAGASQRHKHLQLVPLPLVPNGVKVPIEPAINSAQFLGAIGNCPQLPFIHGLIRLDPLLVRSPEEAAVTTLEFYYNLLKKVGLQGEKGMTGKQSGAYNLIITREWMLLIPRVKESFEGILVNSLGCCGAMLVKTEEELQHLREITPFTVLRNVCIPK
ncbi:phosphorylase [Limnoraphis robusta CS-951]|uniref:Phosphorylase n=2 Tax=Limnoraphis TaxID=1332112 RepID=A0A0F5YM13_9CYAN|nr:phosphorylase [Limnoraphis robusta CS-951]KMW70085.1 phosphorylase [Limnoraphis robusta CS-951]